MKNISNYSSTTLSDSEILISNNLQINQNNNAKKDDDDLPRLGRKRTSSKKSVSFNDNISVTDVENWKKYNVDVSGSIELAKLRQKIKEFKAKKAKEQNNCCCVIF